MGGSLYDVTSCLVARWVGFLSRGGSVGGGGCSCLRVSVRGASVGGGLCLGVSVQGGSLSSGVAVREMVNNGRYASYWNAFL